MDVFSALMLVIIAILLSLSLPKMYGEWLLLQNLLDERGSEGLRELLTSKKVWMQRHFCCAFLAMVMVRGVESGYLAEGAPHLSRITAVYAVISLILAFVESLFAQKITTLLAGAREYRRNEPKYR